MELVVDMPSIIGVEVAKTSVLCCKLEAVPDSPAEFARSYSPIPLLSDIQGVQQLLELGDIYVLEPTGDYSKFWIRILRDNNKKLLRVSPHRVRALKEYHGISSKTDRYDAAFLAIYGAKNLDDPTAFLSEYAEDLREVTLHHSFISRMTTNHQRRLWQLLSHEWPEVCRNRGGGKPQQFRPFLSPEPPALIRFIAGEEIRIQKHRNSQLEASVGSGLSPLSRALARQICELERQQYQCDRQIEALLSLDQFTPYHEVFDSFGFGQLTRSVLLSRIYPFERFLVNGVQEVVRVPSSKTEGRYHRRNKSLGAFRLSLGNGTQAYQSGQLKVQQSAGSKVARNALYLHVKVAVVMGAARKPPSQQILRGHIDFYQSLGAMPHKQAVMKVVARIVRDLYRELYQRLA